MRALINSAACARPLYFVMELAKHTHALP